jgi:hypothetical protein
MANVLMVIEPYWYQDTWVFDDASVGLDKEPFVQGIPEMIDRLVQDIPNARSGFVLLFSSQPFVGYQVELTRVREEYGGWWYKAKDYGAQRVGCVLHYLGTLTMLQNPSILRQNQVVVDMNQAKWKLSRRG